MIVKERNDLSPIFMRALSLANDRYVDDLNQWLDEWEFDYQISVTSLAKPPRERQLTERNYDEIVIDPMDNYWTLFGNAVHNILESAVIEGEKVEERLGVIIKVLGKNVLIHGQADYYCRKDAYLEDHKYTSAWSVLKEKDEHVAQLNVLAWIWRMDGKPVEEIKNNYLFRDWSPRNKHIEGYPQEQALLVPVPLWKTKNVVEYVTERAEAHIKAAEAKTEDLPLCSEKERWADGGGMRIHYKTQKGEWSKRPYFCRTKEEFKKRIEELKGREIKKEKVHAKPKKCLNYCLAAPFCSQHKEYLKETNNEN